ncbi:hypothetical protein FRB90_008877 [Tulasnella sp. 427]|nr:hypothetical protein FRB90_008877 [Tulasnella sp. 427]
MDISVLQEMRGGSPTPSRDPRPPRMLVYKGDNAPQSNDGDGLDYEFMEILRSYCSPATPPPEPSQQFPRDSSVCNPAPLISPVYPRSVSSASDTSYQETNLEEALRSAPNSPSYPLSRPERWTSRLSTDEPTAGGVWSPTFGPRPSTDYGQPMCLTPRPQSFFDSAFDREGGEGVDNSWEFSQYVSSDRPANSSFKGLDFASNDVPQEYLESQFTPDRRRHSMSADEIDALPPYHIVCWTSDGQEKVWTPEDPYSIKIFAAYENDNARDLEAGIYIWHDECGVEWDFHVFDEASSGESDWKEVPIEEAKVAVPSIVLVAT